MADRRVQVVLSEGCLKLVPALASTHLFSGSRAAAPMSTVASSDGSKDTARGAFHGLTICVTGLSKEARKQVQEATMRMGGQYSPDLHPQCSHLVVQSFGGRKYEHAMKHGLKRGLYVVTLAWFVNCVKQNERLDESLYSVQGIVNVGAPVEDVSHVVRVAGGEHSCLPAIHQQEAQSISLATQSSSLPLHKDALKRECLFGGMRFFLDTDLSNESKEKITEALAKEGASFTDHWYIGSVATHVVCEAGFMPKYLGFNVNLVTPLWVMKSVRERRPQRLVQLSADLARHVSILLNGRQNGHAPEGLVGKKILALSGPGDELNLESELWEREQKANAAKACVRRRRGPCMQPCRTIPKPITPSMILETVCWSITDPPSVAQFYTDSSNGTLQGIGIEEEPFEKAHRYFNGHEDRHDLQTLSGIPEDAIYTRPMSESEKKEVVLKASFLTVLFPIDRFAEVGPSSRTFFSEKGFQRHQILELIWTFYQEYMTPGEVEVAIHSDSKHADKLRTVYADKETVEQGYISLKRCEFLGSRKCFEGLKRSGRENTSQVYELWLGA